MPKQGAVKTSPARPYIFIYIYRGGTGLIHTCLPWAGRFKRNERAAPLTKFSNYERLSRDH